MFSPRRRARMRSWPRPWCRSRRSTWRWSNNWSSGWRRANCSGRRRARGRTRRWSWARNVQRMNNALPVTAYIGEANAPNSGPDIGARACFVTRVQIEHPGLTAIGDKKSNDRIGHGASSTRSLQVTPPSVLRCTQPRTSGEMDPPPTQPKESSRKNVGPSKISSIDGRQLHDAPPSTLSQ